MKLDFCYSQQNYTHHVSCQKSSWLQSNMSRLTWKSLRWGGMTLKCLSMRSWLILLISLGNHVLLSRRGLCQPAGIPAVHDGPSRVSLPLDCAELQSVNQTHRHPWPDPHINMMLTVPLSPEGRVDPDVVRLWHSRCSPPEAGWRREILLILRQHLWCTLPRCSRACLTALFFLLIFLLFSLFYTSGFSCSFQGCGIRPAEFLLCVLGDPASWRVIRNFMRISMHMQQQDFLLIIPPYLDKYVII